MVWRTLLLEICTVIYSETQSLGFLSDTEEKKKKKQ